MTLRDGHDSSVSGPSSATSSSAAWCSSAGPAALVLGFGNVLLSDDGAGVQLVQRLRLDPTLRECEFIDGGTMSFSLLAYVEATNSMLVIDAAELHGPPGTIALFDGTAMDDFLKSARRRTVHEVGLIDLMDIARLQDCLPDRRALLCVQPALIEWGETLSAPVEKALTEAAVQAKALLSRWSIA